jgi:hypothetical protein
VAPPKHRVFRPELPPAARGDAHTIVKSERDSQGRLNRMWIAQPDGKIEVFVCQRVLVDAVKHVSRPPEDK